jgi:hypothetical protein
VLTTANTLHPPATEPEIVIVIVTVTVTVTETVIETEIETEIEVVVAVEVGLAEGVRGLLRHANRTLKIATTPSAWTSSKVAASRAQIVS